ncbi:hypothetical protein DFH06DRAFT_1160039 [Mycena polygramma]|nr:hypothetical protein DFH06DRAFT_1160039 [Mycena polygramma]
MGKILRYIVLGAAICGIVGAIVAPLAAPAVLGIVGFSEIGPVAGGFAAAAQAGIGNVVAGSPFAVAQCVAMGGALPAIGYVGAGGIAGLFGGFFGWIASFF